MCAPHYGFGVWGLGFDRDVPGDELAAVDHDPVHPAVSGFVVSPCTLEPKP